MPNMSACSLGFPGRLDSSDLYLKKSGHENIECVWKASTMESTNL